MSKNPSKGLVLLVNLGSIDQPKKFSVARFLFQFLSDKRVVQLPKVLWYPILSLIILLRSKKTLKKYSEISIQSQSPLLFYNNSLAVKLQSVRTNDVVEVAYLYGVAGRSVKEVLLRAHKNYHVDHLIVIPMYPQYSSTTTAAVFDKIANFYNAYIYIPKISFVNEFAVDDVYVKTVVNSIRNYWQQYGKISKVIILSFHALPIKLVKKGDCYEKQCYETFSLIKQCLQFDEVDVLIGFQSKFGYEKWLQPSTMQVIAKLAEHGYDSVDIVAPGFVCDCLETLEEIALSYSEFFSTRCSGGVLRYIPCLNDSVAGVEMLDKLVSKVY